MYTPGDLFEGQLGLFLYLLHLSECFNTHSLVSALARVEQLTEDDKTTRAREKDGENHPRSVHLKALQPV